MTLARYCLSRMAFAIEGTILYWQQRVRASASASSSAKVSVPLADLYREFLEELQKPMIKTIKMRGQGMLPTINKGFGPDEIGETLFIRRVPIPIQKMAIFRGDVVMAKDSTSDSSTDSWMIRRVVALENDEMISSSEEDEPFRVPKGHCWLLADNEELGMEEVVDSRKLGPINMMDIFGRVIYACRSKVDHGPMENSQEAYILDEPIIAHEIDLEKAKLD